LDHHRDKQNGSTTLGIQGRDINAAGARPYDAKEVTWRFNLT
jgi:hypothetical protein